MSEKNKLREDFIVKEGQRVIGKLHSIAKKELVIGSNLQKIHYLQLDIVNCFA